MCSARSLAVLSSYRQLLRLIHRLPSSQKESALAQACSTVRDRRHITNPEENLAHQKELAAKIAYLRVITPRRPSDASKEAGTYVLRDGKWVKGKGEQIGSRVADGTISMDEAMRKNNDHFKRLYGADKPKNMFF